MPAASISAMEELKLEGAAGNICCVVIRSKFLAGELHLGLRQKRQRPRQVLGVDGLSE